MTLNVPNRTLFHGDNLPVLKGINSNSVDVIATDPPFQKGRDFHATPTSLSAGASFQDRWRWEPEHSQWQQEVADAGWPQVADLIETARTCHSDDMGAFLSFMSVREIEFKRLLKPTGSHFLHCDPTASHYLKMMLDSIYGEAQFRNEIVWKRTAGRSDAHRFGRVHDVILYYAGEEATWNTQWLPHDPDYVKRSYRHEDERGRWRACQLLAAGTSGGLSGTSWKGVSPTERGRHWSTPSKGSMNEFLKGYIPGWPEDYETVHDRLDALDEYGFIYWPENGTTPCLKRYLAATNGRAVEDVISDIGKLEATSKEKVGYPTQKPLALYDRIIQASSNRDDVVLDPFAGCATTCVAAERAGRRWIGIDLWEKTHQVTLERLEREGLAVAGRETTNGLLSFGDIHYETSPPERTDQLDTAAVPVLVTPEGKPAASGRLSGRLKAELKIRLIQEGGLDCAGCDRTLPHEDYLDIDHRLPVSDGGTNEFSNLCLLCQPCNRLKSNTFTLTGLRRENKKRRFMADQQPAHRHPPQVVAAV